MKKVWAMSEPFFNLLYFEGNLKREGRLMVRLRVSGVLLVIFGLFTQGCGSSESEKEVVVERQEMQDISNQMLADGLLLLPDWLGYWREQGFSGYATDFDLAQSSPIENLERPEINPLKESESMLAKHQIRHPKGLGVIDVFDYKVRIDEQGGILYEPDSEVIFYRENGMRERLLFIGPSGLFEDAAWIDDQHLIVAGFFEGESGFSPVLWIVSLDNGFYHMFESSYTNPEYLRHGYLEEKLSLPR